ncbi:MAG: hypothetical protein HEP71_30075 [Roseivirga sp.]|nr:hypothetical protein [Roseivirga sp.]
MKSTIFAISLLAAFSFYTKAQDLPIKDKGKTVTVSTKVMDNYTGHYRIETMSLVIEIVREENSLYAIVAGMGKLQLTAGTETAFFNNDIQAQIEFPDEKNKAKKLTLYQAGQQLTGIRIDPPKELTYEKIAVGTSRIDYSKTYQAFESEWNLIIRDDTVGSASIHLRHTIYHNEPAYHGGSVIRYNSMGNKPFADMGFFAKKDFRLLEARNAISQKDEVIGTLSGSTLRQSTFNINTGEIIETKIINLNEPIFGSGIYKLLSMELKTDMTVEFPVSGFDDIAWEKAHISAREVMHVEALNRTYNAWKVEYSSGTIKWISNEAPYLIKWQMPTGMIWELKKLLK